MSQDGTDVSVRRFAVVLYDGESRSFLWSAEGEGPDEDAAEMAASAGIIGFEAMNPEVWIEEANVYVPADDEWYEYKRTDIIGETYSDVGVDVMRIEELDLEGFAPSARSTPRCPVSSKPQMRYFPLVGWEHYDRVEKPRDTSKLCPQMSFIDDFNAKRGEYIHGANDLFGAPGTPNVTVVSGIGWERPDRRENKDGTYTHWNTGGGWHYYLLGDDGLIYYYSHLLKQPVLKVGQRVEAGQYIAPLGATGNAKNTCPHTHFAMYATNLPAGKRTKDDLRNVRKGRQLNPYKHIKALEGAARGGPNLRPGQSLGGGSGFFTGAVILAGIAAVAGGAIWAMRRAAARRRGSAGPVSGSRFSGGHTARSRWVEAGGEVF